MKRERIPEVHFYEWRISAWITSETRDRLDATGRGIYRELLDQCYAQGDFPDDPAWICRRCACTPEQLDAVWPVIEKHFKKSRRAGYRESIPANIIRKEYFLYVKTQRNNRKKGIDKARAARQLQNDGQTVVQPNGNGNGNGKLTATAREREREQNAPARPPAAPQLVELPKSPDYQQRFDTLYAKHPVAGFKSDGQIRYLEIIRTAVHPEKAADAIDRTHAEYCAFWQANPAEFKPGIGKFFEDGWYLRKPQARARDSTQSRRLTPTEVALQRAREEERNAARTQ